MNAGWPVMVVAMALLAGCAGGEPANPNLAAPKLVVSPRGEGNATVFVHSAFSERAYEWIEMRVDNVTVVNKTSAFSVEEVLPPSFYLEVSAESGDTLYVLAARIDVFALDDRASVSFVDKTGKWSAQPESFGLPFEHLLSRRAN